MASKIAAKVFDSKGAENGQFDLDPELFVSSVNRAVVYDAVRYQLLKRRSGTHSCLTKGEMKGGGKKPWKQKGTGRARSGTNTSPVWVGGAVAHGPKTRSYENRTMKRTRRQSLAAVLADKARTGALLCFDSLEISRTREFAALLKTLNLSGKKVLLVAAEAPAKIAKTDCANTVAVRSGRNIPGLKVVGSKGLNTYDVVNSDAVLLPKEILSSFQDSLKCEACAS